MNAPYNLQHFVDAQTPVYKTVCAELRAGRKRTHWMWFIFPQIEGLGRSELARKYAISSVEEAKAYLAHPVLGPRLQECSQFVADIDGRLIEDIFSYPDDMKFQSSMTLFAHIAAENGVFHACLRKYFGGMPDSATLERL